MCSAQKHPLIATHAQERYKNNWHERQMDDAQRDKNIFILFFTDGVFQGTIDERREIPFATYSTQTDLGPSGFCSSNAGRSSDVGAFLM